MRLLTVLSLVSLLSGCATSTRPTKHRIARSLEANIWADSAEPAIPDADPGTPDLSAEFGKRWAAAAASADDRKTPFIPADAGSIHESADIDKLLAEQVDLKTLTSLLGVRNPTVKAADINVYAVLQRYPQAADLDDVLSTYNAFTKQLNTTVSTQPHKRMLAMSFPYPDGLALKGRIIDDDIALAMDAYQIAVRDAVTSLRQSYHNLLFVDAAITINKESQELLEQMISAAQAKIRVDKGKYNAVIMAQVELSKLADAVITLVEQRETLRAQINSLLNRLPDAPLGSLATVPDEVLAVDLGSVYSIVLEDRQELQQQRRRIARMKTMIELATRMAYPDASVGASYFEDGMRLSSGTGTAPPAFPTRRNASHSKAAAFGQRDAYVREVKTRVKGMEQMLAGMEDKARLAAKKGHFAQETARRSISLYRHSLLPQANQAVEATASSYRTGKSDFLSFLDAERTLLKFRLEEQRALRNLRIELARLEQIAGRPLPRKPLPKEVKK
jgi:hypothetical protein